MQRGFFPRDLDKFIKSKTGTYRLRNRTNRLLSQRRTALWSTLRRWNPVCHLVFPVSCCRISRKSTIMKTAQASWVPMYIQVQVSIIHTIQPVISLKASSESREHQITKHQTVAAEKKVTTGLNRRFSPNVPHFKLTQSQRHFCEAFSSISMTVLRDPCKALH